MVFCHPKIFSGSIWLLLWKVSAAATGNLESGQVASMQASWLGSRPGIRMAWRLEADSSEPGTDTCWLRCRLEAWGWDMEAGYPPSELPSTSCQRWVAFMNKVKKMNNNHTIRFNGKDYRLEKVVAGQSLLGPRLVKSGEFWCRRQQRGSIVTYLLKNSTQK